MSTQTPERVRARPRAAPAGTRWRDRAATVLLAAAAMVLTLALSGGLAGLRVFVVKSGSMTPTLQVGDLVVSRLTDPAQLHPGDVATFEHPTLHLPVTHRVVTIQRSGAIVNVVTKGDGNTATEQWSVRADHRIGQMVATVPTAILVQSLTGRVGRTGIVLLVCALLAVSLTRRIWRGTVLSGSRPPGDRGSPPSSGCRRHGREQREPRPGSRDRPSHLS